VRAQEAAAADGLAQSVADLLHVRRNTGQEVVPVFEGWEPNADGSFNMVFGFFNRNCQEVLQIPVGPDNSIEPGGPDQGQPAHFFPRRSRFTFRVTVPADFGDRELVWKITANGKTEYAFATLKPDYIIDERIMMMNNGGFGGRGQRLGEPDNVPPSVRLRGAATRSVKAGEPLDWSEVPSADKPESPRNGKLLKPISVALRDGQPVVLASSGRETDDSGFRVETAHGPVYVGVVPSERILDAAACFTVLDHAKHMKCAPIIWNHWERLPTDSARLATLMMGSTIECCAPVVISDRDQIHELVELANKVKIPTRREIEPSGQATIDLGYVWGLDGAFRMVTKSRPARCSRLALDRYRSLA